MHLLPIFCASFETIKNQSSMFFLYSWFNSYENILSGPKKQLLDDVFAYHVHGGLVSTQNNQPNKKTPPIQKCSNVKKFQVCIPIIPVLPRGRRIVNFRPAWERLGLKKSEPNSRKEYYKSNYINSNNNNKVTGILWNILNKIQKATQRWMNYRIFFTVNY